MQVGNESFFGSSEEYIKDTMISLDDLCKKACVAYFNDKEGKAVYSRINKNKNPQANNAVIPFGPWVMWGKDDKKEIKIPMIINQPQHHPTYHNHKKIEEEEEKINNLMIETDLDLVQENPLHLILNKNTTTKRPVYI